MKRINNLYHKICSIENLHAADAIARKGKARHSDIAIHDQTRESNIAKLHQQLIDKTYATSSYSTFKIYEPKERIVYRLPYYPDRIVHHAIMQYLEPVFIKTFTSDTYSCIKGKGIHAAAKAVRKALVNDSETTFCLKLDIKKFYPSVSHSVLKSLLRKKFKDQNLLWLLDEIIDSAKGLPIGNYLSQFLANFYLSYFDHWIKETKSVKFYFRYADDIVILSNDKGYLHQLFAEISKYLYINLGLKVKANYQIFPVHSRSIDFVGYCFSHSHTRLRKTIKQGFARMLVQNKNPASIASYNGWIKHCNGRHLQKKLLRKAI